MSGETAVVESKLSDASDLVIARLDAFLVNPDDIETNHKLRVSIRTLRGLVSFLEPWQKRKQNGRVQRTLKKVVAAAKGRKCTVRVRAYSKKAMGKAVYSPWSAAKTVKVRKR